MGVADFFFIAIDKIKTAIVNVGSALKHFFERALDFIRGVIAKCAQMIRGVIQGVAHFYRRVGNKYQEGTRIRSLDKEIGKWNIKVITREIAEEDVPLKYRALDGEFEVDDTRELDEALVC